jgi:Zinc carboxypeptidase
VQAVQIRILKIINKTMMYRILTYLFPAVFVVNATAQQTPYEKGGKNVTATYQECIAFYQKLDKQSPLVQVKTMGPTDAGFPLHLVMVSADKNFDPIQWHAKGKTILLINNGIHPGEPDGIDASMMLVRDMAAKKITLPENVALAFIPVYNIGGCLNRSTDFRVDQNGPEAFGSRGNSQNLDLNRDFIKCDSREAKSFAEIFHYLDPDIFIDNHVSNGADYQHVMTLISSQHNKLGEKMGEYMNQVFEPALFDMMKKKNYDMSPYVNFFGETPDSGWPEFMDGPRYSSGYATLWHTFAFVPETHMLKPYWQRVDATYKLMECFIQFAARNGNTIRQLRTETKEQVSKQYEFVLDWTLDKTRFKEIVFKGYEAGRKPSEISGLPRLYYDRNKPFEKKIPFYNEYTPSIKISKPWLYIIPQGWHKVIELLKLNKVAMRQLSKDETYSVEAYRIADYKTAPRQYEGHHANSDVKVDTMYITMQFRKGDYYIPMNQSANRFVMEVLDPRAPDSYFAWNYFDPILGQKEGFSSYVFEETALQLLKEDTKLRAALDARKQSDTAFAKNGSAQLNYIFRNSKYAEPGYMRYPVYRAVKTNIRSLELE